MAIEGAYPNASGGFGGYRHRHRQHIAIGQGPYLSLYSFGLL